MKKICLILLLPLLMVACGTKDTTTVSLTGEIKGLGNDTIYLYATDNFYNKMDTIPVTDGKFTATLKPDTLLLNDLCPEMEECVENLLVESLISERGQTACHGLVRFVAGDAEELEFPSGTDLMTSCSTLQWFNDPAAFFARSRRFLKPGGILAFTTFGPSNMHEIRSLTGHGLDYLPLDEVRRLVALHFDVRYAAEEVVSLPFADPTAVLRHLKLTGVTGTEKRTWTRRRLQAFSEDYTRRFAQADGNVTLTYHPIYIIAQNKTL